MYIKAYKNEGDARVMTDYAELSNLSFAPRADLMGDSVPINEFQADIHTADDIEIGAYAELYDDLDNLWAAYWVIEAERVSAGVLRLRAQSDIALLERARMGAVYYDGWRARQVLDQVMGEAVGVPYALDAAFEDATVTGFCPEQSARERLLWVCFVLGACVRTCFNDRVEIVPIDAGQALVPLGDTYYKPAVTHGDWVTGIRVRAYTFAPGEPGPRDRYVVSAAGVCYILTQTEVTLTNPAAPAAAPENIVSVEGVYLVNPDNVSALLNRLARWAFTRARLDIEVIDNGDYAPGDRLAVYTGTGEMATGYVDRAVFRFGTQARAALRLIGVEPLPCGGVTIWYQWDGFTVGRADYTFPVGYAYAVDNAWIDARLNGHRYLFRPLNARAEGVVQAEQAADIQPCAAALDLYAGVLHVVSVDGVSESNGRGVIA